MELISKMELEYLKWAINTYGMDAIVNAVYMEQQELTASNVGIVLGGPANVLDKRVEKALELWDDGLIKDLLVLSGKHSFFDVKGYLGLKPSEAERMFEIIKDKNKYSYYVLQYADKMGIRRNISDKELYILLETASTSTDGNALHTSDRLLDFYGTLPKSTIITSASHINRAAGIFRKYFSEELLQYCGASDDIGDKEVFLKNPNNLTVARELFMQVFFNDLYGLPHPLSKVKKL